LQAEQVLDELQVRQPMIEQREDTHWLELTSRVNPMLQIAQTLEEEHEVQLAMEQLNSQTLAESCSPFAQT
jgi:hypothetical protein